MRISETTRRMLGRGCLGLALLCLIALCLDRTPLLPLAIAACAFSAFGFWATRGAFLRGFDIKGWALAAVTTLCLLAFLEVAVRLLLPPLALPPELYEPHPQALFALRPQTDIVQRFENLQQAEALEVPVRINRHGFRGPELPAEKSPGEFRILCLGDSYTFGWGSLEDSTYPARLQRELQDRLPRRAITVVNAGTGGQGPWQERILLNERGFALQPDLVLLQVFPGNDVSDSLLREGTTTLVSFPVDSFDHAAAYRVIHHPVARLNEWLRRASRLYLEIETRLMGRWMLVRIYNRLRFVTLPGYRPPQLPGQRSWIVEPDLKEWYPELTLAWNLLERDIAGIHNDCKQRRIPLAAFAMPWLAGDERYLTEVAKHGEHHYQRDKAAHMMESVLQDHADLMVPMVQALRAEPGQEDLIYPADGHLNPAGNALVARRLADALAPFIEDRMAR